MDAFLSSHGSSWGVLLLAIVAGSTYIAWSFRALGQRGRIDLSTRVPPPARPKLQADTDEDTADALHSTSIPESDAGDLNALPGTMSADDGAARSGQQKEHAIRQSNSEYTVGWICAVVTELVAARLFLDERHQRPEALASNDTNTYTLGRIGGHNVVIASLPDGEYGIASATGVAKDMLHSFPNVKIGLMVGIGGGAPGLKHDIRLGDVVISSPRDGHGGVFQYDFGKAIGGHEFRPTGFLNQPPVLLRSALSSLKAEYKEHGHQIKQTIDSLLKKSLRSLQQEYGRPQPRSDRLYRAEVSHLSVDEETNCEESCGDEATKLVVRHPRANDADPVVHYGLIASANTLMKDASIRDRLAREKGVLCFEMEAAGLMNQFPCLVIRGICDYSDTHKNKEWQGYAAMTAAAYAKDLLRQITPRQAEAEATIADVLGSR
jgi:nucleoside phosphorylase